MRNLRNSSSISEINQDRKDIAVVDSVSVRDLGLRCDQFPRKKSNHH